MDYFDKDNKVEIPSFFGGYCLGVPQESNGKLFFPLCNKETGELRFWVSVSELGLQVELYGI